MRWKNRQRMGNAMGFHNGTWSNFYYLDQKYNKKEWSIETSLIYDFWFGCEYEVIDRDVLKQEMNPNEPTG